MRNVWLRCDACAIDSAMLVVVRSDSEADPFPCVRCGRVPSNAQVWDAKRIKERPRRKRRSA